MTDPKYQEILSKYPALTYLTYGGNEYIGVVQNIDDIITTIYDFGVLKTDEQRLNYLELADAWWWESNRAIPINVFLRQDWTVFKPTLKTFNSKDVVIICGPSVSLKEIAAKRSKKRSITLVRRPT